MKMNKIIKVLVAGAMLVLAVGCEEAKEVENIEIKGAQEVVEQVEEKEVVEEEVKEVEENNKVLCESCGHYVDYVEYDANMNMKICDDCFNKAFDEHLNAQEPQGIKYECLDCHKWYNEDEMLNSVRCKDCYNARMDALNEADPKEAVINPNDPEYNKNCCPVCGSYEINLINLGEGLYNCHECNANFNK